MQAMKDLDQHLMEQLREIYSGFLADAEKLYRERRSLSGFLKLLFPGKTQLSNRSGAFAEEIASYAASLTEEDDVDSILCYVIGTALEAKGELALSLILTAVWQYFVPFIPCLDPERAQAFARQIEEGYPPRARTPVMEAFLRSLHERGAQ